jgi:hypothetical protein
MTGTRGVACSSAPAFFPCPPPPHSHCHRQVCIKVARFLTTLCHDSSDAVDQVRAKQNLSAAHLLPYPASQGRVCFSLLMKQIVRHGGVQHMVAALQKHRLEAFVVAKCQVLLVALSRSDAAMDELLLAFEVRDSPGCAGSAR